VGPQFSDEALLVLADRFHRSQVMLPGAPVQTGLVPPGCIALAVVGAHLADQPMHWQIIEARARLLKSTRTAPGYRLFALEEAKPPKAGLVRDERCLGPGIEVEVYAMPEDHFGAFAVAVPAPL